MITAITPTGDRPLAFVLCQIWMMRQTVQPDQWIVIDDGSKPMPQIIQMQYIKRSPLFSPAQPPPSSFPLSFVGLKTNRHPHAHLSRRYLRTPKAGWVSIYNNLRTAASHIQGDKIIFIEDDEYYAPNYIEEIAKKLNGHELVGIRDSRYYHLPSGGYRIFRGQAHASLAQTAFQASFLPVFNEFLGTGYCAEYLDIRLWTQQRSRPDPTVNKLRTNCRGHLFLDEPPLYVALKGLPGRGGYGIGHKAETYRQFDTADRAMLRHWIPENYAIYLDMLNGKLTEKNYEQYFSA